MGNFSTSILSTLESITGNGSFHTSGVQPFLLPGLCIQGFGEMAFPLSAYQANDAIQFARKAPYGKGSKTITDPHVRDAWEIDATQIVFGNPQWPKYMELIMDEVKEGLGIESPKVRASLYKLLIYEKGHFFLPHKDSEKEKGMFGTLVVGLPSQHTGGALHIRFDGREEIADFSLTDRFSIPYTAFYADCEHEIKPITDGYRVALVYNLIQEGKTKAQVRAPRFSEQVAQISNLLETEAATPFEEPIAILLEHQHTPANFGRSSLKLHDLPRAEALILAAENAGYFAALGLVSHHLQGEMIGSHRSSRYSSWRRRYDDEYDDDFENAEMGEVYEEDTCVEHWATDGVPGLGNIDFDVDKIIGGGKIGEDDPLEKDGEGYTGNAGMTLGYWYHYGAVILWPQKQHNDILASQNIEVQLEWLQFFLQNWTSSTFAAPDLAAESLEGVVENIIAAERLPKADFSPLLRTMIHFPQNEALLQQISSSLPMFFEKIKAKEWVKFAEVMGCEMLDTVLDTAAARGKIVVTKKITKAIATLLNQDDPTLKQLGQAQLQKLPAHIMLVDLPNEIEKQTAYWAAQYDDNTEDSQKLLKNILGICQSLEGNAEWVNAAFEAIVRTMPRKYIHKTLSPILLEESTPQSALRIALIGDCMAHLKV